MIQVQIDDRLAEDMKGYADAQGVDLSEFLRRVVLKEFRPMELKEVLG